MTTLLSYYYSQTITPMPCIIVNFVVAE